jgi:BirA family transcriptional regulator, biotin operon repressor / biotin---[acetyl-CoA-carboxylase] ligase
MLEQTTEAFLDADEIRAATFVRHVEIHETLGSTNDRAAELTRDPDIKLPALVAARHQTAGRGRGSNSWWSADGALTFSIVLEPAVYGIDTANWPQLSLATAVAVCDALAFELDPQSKNRNPKSAGLAIKWPNDIMLGGRKVCGILIESPGGISPAKDRLVVGIGINVNNSLRSAPRELAGYATSLCDTSGKQHSRQEVLIRVANELQRQLVRLERHDPQLPLAWQELCWLSHQNVSAQVGQRVVEGICTGIADDGALLIQTASTTDRIYGGNLRLKA